MIETRLTWGQIWQLKYNNIWVWIIFDPFQYILHPEHLCSLIIHFIKINLHRKWWQVMHIFPLVGMKLNKMKWARRIGLVILQTTIFTFSFRPNISVCPCSKKKRQKSLQECWRTHSDILSNYKPLNGLLCECKITALKCFAEIRPTGSPWGYKSNFT